jgi:superfamily II DNA/RNA helicase
VHRAGRTARAGKQGRVFTLVAENEGPLAKAAEKAGRVKLRPYTLRIDGKVVTRAEHSSAKREIPGGNAKGAERKKRPVPRPPATSKAKPLEDEPSRGKEFDLPPSRRRRE